MILSLLPVSKSTLPFGCLMTKKPTGTWIVGSFGALFTKAPLPMVRAPELKAYSLVSCACATEKQAADGDCGDTC